MWRCKHPEVILSTGRRTYMTPRIDLAEEVITEDGTTIREQNKVDAPTGTGPAKKIITVEAEADLLKEYVGATESTYRPWQADRYIRSLPNPSDELMLNFGNRIYEIDMPLDPQ